MERSARTFSIDRAGAVCSAVCAVHCGVVALAPSVFSALGFGLLLGPAGEWGFTVVAAAFAVVAAAYGLRKHRCWPVAATFAAGIAGLIASRLLEEFGGEGIGTIVGVGAALLLIVAHVLNIHRARVGVVHVPFGHG